MGLSEMEISRLVEGMTFANNAMLARLNAQLQASLPVYVEERATSPQVPISTAATLAIPPARDTYFKVTGLVVVVPIGTTAAALQLGSDWTLPLQNTFTALNNIQRILTSTDVRELTFTNGTTGAGTAFVWLYGEALPKYGKM